MGIMSWWKPGSISEISCGAGITHQSFVIEQQGSEHFNRGYLLNIGFLAAAASADYIAVHDADLLPAASVSYAFPR